MASPIPSVGGRERSTEPTRKSGFRLRNRSRSAERIIVAQKLPVLTPTAVSMRPAQPDMVVNSSQIWHSLPVAQSLNRSLVSAKSAVKHFLMIFLLGLSAESVVMFQGSSFPETEPEYLEKCNH